MGIEVQHNNTIQHGETIATLANNSYKTETGGIVTYNLEKKFATKKRKGPGKLFSGTLYWIPEETYRVESSTSTCNIPLLFVKVLGIISFPFAIKVLFLVCNFSSNVELSTLYVSSGIQYKVPEKSLPGPFRFFVANF